LIRAIVSDYDLAKPDDLEIVREYLETLHISAIADNASSFDPSGTTASGLEANRSNASPYSASDLTESSGACTGVSGRRLDSASGSSSTDTKYHELGDNAGLAEDAKLAMLQELFPTLRPTDVAFTLQKCNYDISNAMDILLNQVFFDESSASNDVDVIVARGVDAFSEDNNARRARSRKKKSKKFQNVDEYARSYSTPAQEPVNKWENANSDVAFIASRVKMSTPAITSLYHKKGASQAKTILALLEDQIRIAPSHNEDINLVVPSVELHQDFPTLSYEYCTALIHLTTPSTANAHELAKVLTRSPGGEGFTRLTPQYAPVKFSDTSATSRATSPSASTTSVDSRTLLIARSAAFDNASKYHRKGKSDRLMGGATAYYSQLGRDYSAAIHSAVSVEADTLAASQSSSTHLDLHGVTVKEATRIACERAQFWWDKLGESRIQGGGRAIGPGYRIVTGLGRHSEGGVPKLGPAVTKALISHGWKVEVGSGELLVTGKRR
jgi:hypothetical protein